MREHFRTCCHVDPSSFDADFLSSAESAVHAALARARSSAHASVPFSAGELQHALTSCSDSAVGPDGLPYKAFSVALPWWQSAILDFFCLVQYLCVVPRIWLRSVVVPIWKSGSWHAVDNYRPISLACCALKLFERLVLQRIQPFLGPRLDRAQAGFVLGADV